MFANPLTRSLPAYFRAIRPKSRPSLPGDARQHEIRAVIAAKQDHELDRQRAIFADDERGRFAPPPHGWNAIAPAS